MGFNMKKSLLLLAALFFVVGLQAQECGPYRFRNNSIADSAGLKVIGGDTFLLASNYPTDLPEKVTQPWEKIDYAKKPESYMKSVLEYLFAGFEEVDFRAERNQDRYWYHAPWMDHGYAGREPMHGLVMDYTAYSEDFNTAEKGKARNYSITYYNDRAAYTLGQVWCDPNNPDPTKAKFEEGSVFFSLVFTTADSVLFPFLANTLKWEAYVEKNTLLPIDDKKVSLIRLFEVDFSVRTDKSPTGWVFGSFLFDGTEGEDLQSRLLPVSLQWGNDPGVTPKMVREAASEEGSGEILIKESWINSEAYNPDDKENTLLRHMGYAGRAQRPLGSRSGAHLSEAMTASWPVLPAIAPDNISQDSAMQWFRNVPHGENFIEGYQSLDYCLELRDGLRNHAIANGDSTLKIEYEEALSDVLGFIPPDKAKLAEEEEEVVEYDEGLEGRNLFIFIGFIVMVLVIAGLLVMNLMKKS